MLSVETNMPFASSHDMKLLKLFFPSTMPDRLDAACRKTLPHPYAAGEIDRVRAG